MNHKEFSFSHLKIELFGQYWEPKRIRAIILLVHGMGEHSSRYMEFVIPQLIKSDLAVITFDNFGHGKSKGKRGHTPSYNAMLEVIDKMIEKGVHLFHDKPVILYGHSMGGNLVINYTLRYPHKINGTIATSPFLRLAFQPPKWKITLGKFLKKISPSVTLPTGIDITAISKDSDEVDKYKKDPLVHDRISPNFSFPVMDAGEWALNNAEKLEVPLFLAHGTADLIIDHKASIEFSEKTKNASLYLFKEGYHELHNDFEKEKINRRYNELDE